MRMVDRQPSGFARTASWRGRSGRTYWLSPENLADFLLDEALHVIAKGTNVLWVGSAEDVIADHASRSRFRLALGCADRAYRLESGDDAVERMTTIWDLESAEPIAERSAA